MGEVTDITSLVRTSNNQMKTRALFLETCIHREGALYTLSDQDHHSGRKSIYKAYLDMEDVAEYDFAVKFFGSMRHWRVLCESDWFGPYAEEMRSDLQKKLKSRAIAKIRSEAEDPSNKSHFQANKYLADKGYIEKEAKGRPTKAQVDKEAKRQVDRSTELDAIYGKVGFR